MAEFAALPLYTDAWLADTGHLSRVERGMYMDLLILVWRSPECRVPNEIDWIARKLKCSQDEIPILKDIISEFMTSTGKWLGQKRLRKEFDYWRKKHASHSSRAKSRWDKDKKSTAAYADTHAVAYAPSPSPSPSKKDTDLEIRDSPSTPMRTACLSEGKKGLSNESFETFWKTYPKRQGSPDRKRAEGAFLKALKRSTLDEIVAGVKRYREHLEATGKINTQFVAQAATWLNGERWDEHFDPPKGGNGIDEAERERLLAIIRGQG